MSTVLRVKHQQTIHPHVYIERPGYLTRPARMVVQSLDLSRIWTQDSRVHINCLASYTNQPSSQAHNINAWTVPLQEFTLHKRIMEQMRIFLGHCAALHSKHTQRKKGTKTVPFGYYCYKWYPFFKGALFFLNNHVYEKRVPLRDRCTIHKNSTPRGTVCPISTLFRKSGTILVPFLPEGYCFEAKKGWKQYPFFRGALKQYPFSEGYCFRAKKGRKQNPSGKGYYFSTHRGTLTEGSWGF